MYEYIIYRLLQTEIIIISTEFMTLKTNLSYIIYGS